MADKICKMCERPIRKDGRSAFHPSCYKRHQRKLAHERHVIKTYGLKPGDYDKLLAASGGRCMICGGGSTKALAVDHNHKTGEVRGVTCATCNGQLLGRGARDSIDILKAAVRYMEDPPARTILGD